MVKQIDIFSFLLENKSPILKSENTISQLEMYCPDCSFRNGLSLVERLDMFDFVITQFENSSLLFCTFCSGRFLYKTNGAFGVIQEELL